MVDSQDKSVIRLGLCGLSQVRSGVELLSVLESLDNLSLSAGWTFDCLLVYRSKRGEKLRLVRVGGYFGFSGVVAE